MTTNSIQKKYTSAFTVQFLMILALIGLSSQEVLSADTSYIKLSGSAPISISKGTSTTRKLNVSNVNAGLFRLEMNWYVSSLKPGTFNKLKIELKRNNTTIDTQNCYPIMSFGRKPDCRYSVKIEPSSANTGASWYLKITNSSQYDIRGFDVRKGNDPNPIIPNFSSKFARKRGCTASASMRMQDPASTIRSGKTITKWIVPNTTHINRLEGKFKLKAKWHVDRVIPTFNKLKIELIKPNGQVAKSGYYYSYHAPNKSPKFDITYTISTVEAFAQQGQGSWKLRVTNYSPFKVIRFNITKESTELSPIVPSFESRFSASCY